MSTTKSRIVVFSGPSGCGKSTIINSLRQRTGGVTCISATTRKMRPGEVDGKDYHFLSPERFEAQSQAGEFLEEMSFNGNRYGTRYRDVESASSLGEDVYMDLSCAGASSISSSFDNVLTVFILPPSYKEVKERLRIRGMSDKEIEMRFADDDSPIAQAVEYDLLVVNHTDKQAATVDLLYELLAHRRP